MDDEPSGPPSEEAETQRLEPVMPLVWAGLGLSVILLFVALLVAVGRPS